MFAKIRTLTEPLAHGALDNLSVEEFKGLFSARRHLPVLSGQRAGMIVSRVRLWAILFAALTMLWIVVDAAVFPWPVWGQLALARLMSALALLALAVHYRGEPDMRRAYQALFILFAIPMAFFAFTSFLLDPLDPAGLAGELILVYTFLPYMVAAGISVFPLVLLEGFLLGAFVLAGTWLTTSLCDCGNQIGLVNMFWLLTLIAMVGILASVGQLGFMITLVRQAVRDTLTGAFTRASGAELLDIQYILSTRNQTPMTVAYLDIDDLDKINEGYGHEAGDDLLVEVARRIRTAVRTGDMVVRWSGEEFLLIFPNTSMGNAYNAIERLIHAGLGLKPDGEWVTVSIGVAERQADAVRDWRSLVELSEQRMHEAKGFGKNRVVSPGVEYISM